jgi:hypothetical protein
MKEGACLSGLTRALFEEFAGDVFGVCSHQKTSQSKATSMEGKDGDYSYSWW